MKCVLLKSATLLLRSFRTAEQISEHTSSQKGNFRRFLRMKLFIFLLTVLITTCLDLTRGEDSLNRCDFPDMPEKYDCSRTVIPCSQFRLNGNIGPDKIMHCLTEEEKLYCKLDKINCNVKITDNLMSTTKGGLIGRTDLNELQRFCIRRREWQNQKPGDGNPIATSTTAPSRPPPPKLQLNFFAKIYIELPYDAQEKLYLSTQYAPEIEFPPNSDGEAHLTYNISKDVPVNIGFEPQWALPAGSKVDTDTFEIYPESIRNHTAIKLARLALVKGQEDNRSRRFNFDMYPLKIKVGHNEVAIVRGHVVQYDPGYILFKATVVLTAEIQSGGSTLNATASQLKEMLEGTSPNVIGEGEHSLTLFTRGLLRGQLPIEAYVDFEIYKYN